MKERMRKALGFLGLIEDEYGDYAPSTSVRPFSEQPEYEEPDWASPAPVASSRPLPTSGPTPLRPMPVRPAPSARPGGEAPRLRPQPPAGAAPAGARIRTLAGPIEEELAIVFPVNYDDSRRITDLLRNHRPVLLNLTDLEADVARRVVDFTAGSVYAFRAKIEPLARGVYLVYREETDIPADMRVRLRSTNFRALGPR